MSSSIQKCMLTGSQFIAKSGCLRTSPAYRRRFTYTSAVFHKCARNGSYNQVSSLHQKPAPVFQNRETKSSSPPYSPSSQDSTSDSASLSPFTYAILSITGIILLYVTTSTQPLQLDSAGRTDIPEDEIESEKRYKPYKAISLGLVDASIVQASNSITFQAAGDTVRIDSINISSNPEDGEDVMSVATSSLNGEPMWLMPFILDGHAGVETANAIGHNLVNYLIRHMLVVSPHDLPYADPSVLDEVIKEAFLELDQDIMDEAALALRSTEASAISALAPAFAGSCALLSYYDPHRRMWKTACTGDSRAVLGRFSEETGKWEAIALSQDQTGHNESEVSRLQREHPNEPEMVEDGRVLGLAVTRAFGDCRWKWPRQLQEVARDRFCGPQLRDGLLTPPYLTAEPEITTTEIQPHKGDFIIQASDGLWDELTNTQAVNLIGRWLQEYDPSKGSARSAPVLSQAEVLALARTPDPETVGSGGRQISYNDRVDEDDFIVKDENAASHLVRNALGGGNETRLRGINDFKILPSTLPQPQDL